MGGRMCMRIYRFHSGCGVLANGTRHAHLCDIWLPEEYNTQAPPIPKPTYPRTTQYYRELYRTFQLQECARAQNSAVLIEGLGHRVQVCWCVG